MSTKKILTFIGVLLILLVLFAGSVYLKNRHTSTRPTQENNTSQNGVYTVDNEELGYKFEISDKYFGVNNKTYQEIRNGYLTSYYLKTTDPEWTKDGKNYAEVLTIGAVTKREANLKKPVCAKNNIKLLDTPFDCLIFDQPLGSNKYLYFVVYPHTEEYPKDLSEIKISEAIDEALKNIQIYDPVSEPLTLKYNSYEYGFEFSYPSYIDRAFWDPAKNEELGAQIELPREIDNNQTNISEKVLLHTLPIQYCALSGECRPTTLNFAINVGYTGKTLKQLRESDGGKSLTQKTIGDKLTYVYEIGAEGEGIIYYFTEGPNNKMYVVALRYLNEQIVTKYKTASGFTSFEEQKTTAENIIKNLNFQTPLNQL
jgi:hypothetical protein